MHYQNLLKFLTKKTHTITSIKIDEGDKGDMEVNTSVLFINGWRQYDWYFLVDWCERYTPRRKQLEHVIFKNNERVISEKIYMNGNNCARDSEDINKKINIHTYNTHTDNTVLQKSIAEIVLIIIVLLTMYYTSL